MLNFVDNWLNRITMYRLMLYFLTALIVEVFILAVFKVLPYKPLDIILCVAILIIVSWITNKIFSLLFKVPTNVESDYITALILALIITPFTDQASLIFLVTAAVVAQASKYIIAWKGKHVFNPTAFAVVLTYFAINQGASWWVGNMWTLPLIVIGGLLVTRKLQKFDLVLSFLVVALVAVLWSSPSIETLKTYLINSPILFFAFVMLPEPLTTPPTKSLRIAYGALVGLFLSPSISFGSFYMTPELALVIGNIFSFIVSPKGKHLMTLKAKNLLAPETYELVFEPKNKVNFQPGQYLEWTVNSSGADNRGNRRYFTIASSPTENDVRMGVKFYENPSSFKKLLMAMAPGSKILAGQLSGDFTLPKNENKKLAFIAGGIGITPFRSMIQYFLDNKQKRDLVLFYTNKTPADVAYKDFLDNAAQQLGIKVIYNFGPLTVDTIKSAAPDFANRTFYISGPHGLVDAFEKTLKDIGVPASQIKIDFFPGYA